MSACYRPRTKTKGRKSTRKEKKRKREDSGNVSNGPKDLSIKCGTVLAYSGRPGNNVGVFACSAGAVEGRHVHGSGREASRADRLHLRPERRAWVGMSASPTNWHLGLEKREVVEIKSGGLVAVVEARRLVDWRLS